jgi:uncharacterized membrane protein YeiH
MNHALTEGRHLLGAFAVALDLTGTFVFALSGAVAGVKNRFDLFGLMVLAFVTGNAGGITRDVLIGAVPPAALINLQYLWISILAALVIFFWSSRINVQGKLVLGLDAIGLALFAVTGTQKALAAGLNPVMAALLGMLTGIGGGMIRDVLVNQIPFVLQSDLYAVAALAAGATVVTGNRLHLPSFVGMIVGSALCLGLRLMAIFRGWRLPVARPSP